MSDSDFAQSRSQDLRAASEKVKQKIADPLNDKIQPEMDASAKASTVATLKLYAPRFCESRLQDIFKTL